jgi:lysozyme
MRSLRELNIKQQELGAFGSARQDQRVEAFERLRQSPTMQRAGEYTSAEMLEHEQSSSYREDTVKVSKGELSALSNTLTEFLNAFSKLTASQEYIGEIKKAISEAQIRYQKETALERNAPGPVPAFPAAGEGGDGVGALAQSLGDLTSEVERLATVIEQNGIQSQPFGSGTGLAEKATSFLGTAVAGTVAAVGTYGALQGGSAALKMLTKPPELPDSVEKPKLTGPQRAQSSRYTDKLSQTMEEGARRAATTSQMGGGYTGGGGDGGYGEDSAAGGDLPEVSGGDQWVMDMVKRHEGVVNKIYKDSLGFPTFGVGHLITRNDPEYGKPIGTPVSPARVDEVFIKDFAHHKKIAEETPGYSKANALGKGAMIDLAFNMGKWWPKWPKTKTALDRGDWQGAASGLRDSKWARQVGRRAVTITDMISRAGSATASPPAGSASQTAGGSPTRRTGAAVVNPDNITQSIKGKKIWDYARKNGSDVDWDGLKQGMKDRFLAMAIEYKEKTGNKVAINSANRTYAKQAAIFKKYGAKRAAPPGRSKHESGVAIDINSTDAAKMIQLGLLQKYGFYRPYMPSETWHIEPIEAKKVRGQPDNPYEPGASIVQTGAGGKPITQDSSGRTKPVTDPKRDIGSPTTAAAITAKVGEKQCPVMVQPVPVGGGGQAGPGPAQYLAGIKPTPQAKPISRNPAQEYKMYFAA